MFSSWLFVVIVAVLYISLASVPTRLLPSIFGIANIVALELLFGWRMVAVVLMLTACLWSALFAMKKSGLANSKKPIITLPIMCGFFAIILSVIFLTDIEVLLTRALVGDGITAVQFFVVMGVSYLGLRMWDSMFAVLDGERLVNIIVLSGYLMPFFMVMADQFSIAITCAAWVDHKPS